MEANTDAKTEIEIDLRDLVAVFLNKIIFISSLVLLLALLALIISLVMPKVYSVSSSLEIGTIVKEGGEQVIESVDQVVEKKNRDVYGVLVRQKMNMPQGEYPRITAINGPDTNIITFNTQSGAPDIVKRIFQEVNSEIIAEHQKKFDIAVKEINENIAIENDNKLRLESKIDSLEAEKKVYQSEIASLQKVVFGDFNAGAEFVLLSAKEQLESKRQEIEDLYSEINSSDRKISELQGYLGVMKMTTVIKQPVSSEYPVSPRIALNVIIAALLGFFAATFWVFAREWWNKKS